MNGNVWYKIEKMKESGREFVIYGKTYVHSARVILSCMNIRPAFVIDDDISVQGEMMDFGVIRTFNSIDEPLLYNYIVIIDYMLTIGDKLERAGVPGEQILYLNNWASFGWDKFNNKTYMIDHWDEYMKMTEIFDDEISKQHYIQMCKFRLDNNPKRLRNIKVNAYNQYLDSINPISDDEYYVDVGAFDGRSIEKFVRFTEGKYNRIYAIEASAKSMDNMKKRLCGGGIGRIEYLPYAMTDTDKGDMYFDENLGAGSKFDENGELLVHTISFDSLFADKMVTFIKMDIEGAEWDALHGMTNTIERYRPKLAICIYHSSEDMLRIPWWMQENCKDYNLYIRQHGEGICETVCYGIPGELMRM